MQITSNLYGLWPHLDRIVEIAVQGGFSVYLDSTSDIDHPQKIGDNDAARRFYSDFCTFVEDPAEADILTALNKVDYLSRFARPNGAPAKYNRIDPVSTDIRQGASLSLLKAATEKLEFNYYDLLKCVNIAAVIAAADGATEIEARHIAEATQYRHL